MFFKCLLRSVSKNNVLDDFNRVVLEPEEGVADSDYVNASYVDVSKDPPTPEYTVVSFIAELGAAQGVHCDPGTHGGHHARLLAHGLAGKGLLHCDGYKDF